MALKARGKRSKQSSSPKEDVASFATDLPPATRSGRTFSMSSTVNSPEPSPVDRQQGTTKAETRKANKAKAAETALNVEIETACWSIAYSCISPCLPIHFVKKKSASWTHALVLR